MEGKEGSPAGHMPEREAGGKAPRRLVEPSVQMWDFKCKRLYTAPRNYCTVMKHQKIKDNNITKSE